MVVTLRPKHPWEPAPFPSKMQPHTNTLLISRATIISWVTATYRACMHLHLDRLAEITLWVRRLVLKHSCSDHGSVMLQGIPLSLCASQQSDSEADSGLRFRSDVLRQTKQGISQHVASSQCRACWWSDTNACVVGC